MAITKPTLPVFVQFFFEKKAISNKIKTWKIGICNLKIILNIYLQTLQNLLVCSRINSTINFQLEYKHRL